MAKGKIWAGDQHCHAELLDEQFQERGRFDLGGLEREGMDDAAGDSLCGGQFEPFEWGGEQREGQIWAQEMKGVGGERQQHGVGGRCVGAGQLVSGLLHLLEQCLVAAVEAVEIADGQHAWAGQAGLAKICKNFHGLLSRSSRVTAAIFLPSRARVWVCRCSPPGV